MRGPDATHINVTWDVQFSAISAGRVNLLTGFASPDAQPLAANATEHEVLIAQDAWEQQGKFAFASYQEVAFAELT